MRQACGSLWGDLRASCKFWGFCCHERRVDQPWVLGMVFSPEIGCGNRWLGPLCSPKPRHGYVVARSCSLGRTLTQSGLAPLHEQTLDTCPHLPLCCGWQER